MGPHHIMSNDYMAHGFCFNWENSLVILHVASDIVTGIAYYSIPIAMFYFAYRRRDIPFFKLFILFALFIFSCGTTHFFAAYTVFEPAYWPEGYVKAFTAIVSALTAILLVPRIPEAIALPSIVSTLEEVKKLNDELRIKNAALQITNFSIEKIIDPIYWIAEDSRVMRVNEAACTALGYTCQQILEFSVADIDPHFTMDRWPSFWDNLKQKGTFTFETQHRTQDGRLLDVEASTNYISTEGQEFCCAVIRDITERKQAEKKLREQAELLNLSHDAIIVRDLQDKVVFWSRGAEDTYGWTDEEARGRVAHDLLKARFPKPLDELGAEMAERGIWEGELVHLRRDGREIVVDSRWVAQMDESGLQVGVLEINRDVTERKRAEVALQKLNEELEVRVAQRTEELEKTQAQLKSQNAELETHNKKIQEAHLKLRAETSKRIQILEDLRHKEQLLIQQSRLAAMGEMLVNISHQWRQPLNFLGIKVQELGLSHKYGGFSEQLLDDNIAEAMKVIQHMSQTIDDFQVFLSPNKEKMPFRVEQVISKTVGLVEESFRSQGISFDVNSTGDPQVNGYPNEYGQALLNLLINARDAFVERRVTDARISVLSWVENSRSVVTVSDNAGGIKAEIIDKIFDAYFTTKELGKGTGVGLFLAKTIIEKNMGGHLSVRNIDDGCEFKIEV